MLSDGAVRVLRSYQMNENRYLNCHIESLGDMICFLELRKDLFEEEDLPQVNELCVTMSAMRKHLKCLRR